MCPWYRMTDTSSRVHFVYITRTDFQSESMYHFLNGFHWPRGVKTCSTSARGRVTSNAVHIPGDEHYTPHVLRQYAIGCRLDTGARLAFSTLAKGDANLPAMSTALLNFSLSNIDGSAKQLVMGKFMVQSTKRSSMRRQSMSNVGRHAPHSRAGVPRNHSDLFCAESCAKLLKMFFIRKYERSCLCLALVLAGPKNAKGKKTSKSRMVMSQRPYQRAALARYFFPCHFLSLLDRNFLSQKALSSVFPMME